MTTHLIDASASLRASDTRGPVKLVPWNDGGGGGVRFAGQHAVAVSRSRMDGRSASAILTVSELERAIVATAAARPDFRERLDSIYKGRSQPYYAQDGARGLTRADALSATSGLLFARDLEFVYARVSEEPVAPLNALAIFGVSSQIPIGATSHTVRRFGDSGEARMYRAGEDVPIVGLSAAEESFGIAHLVAGLSINFFEALAHGFAGLDEYGRKLRAVRRAIDTLLNRIAWWGSQDHNLYGFLNYPWVPKRSFGSTITRPANAAAFDSLVLDWHGIINRARQAHKEDADPNRLGVTPELRDFLTQTLHPTYGRSAASLILEGQQRINKIEAAWELAGAGPGGTDVIALWDDSDPDARPAFEVPQGFATLPMETQGFEQRQVAYATTGGMLIRDVRAASLTYVTVSL